MRILGIDTKDFFDSSVRRIETIFERIELKDGLILKLKEPRLREHVEIIKCDGRSSWMFTHEALKHVCVEKDVLVGWVGFEDVQIQEAREETTVFAKASFGSSIVVLRGADKFKLLKNFYTILSSHCGFSIKMPRSLVTASASIEMGNMRNVLCLAMNERDEIGELLKKNIPLVVEVENQEELDEFYKEGVRCFLLKELSKELRREYPDCHFVLSEGLVATALGTADGLIIDIDRSSLEEIVLMSLINRLLVLYVPATKIDTKLLDVLGFGGFGWLRRTNPLFVTIEQKESIYEVVYVNEFNLPSIVRINTSTDSIDWQSEQGEAVLKKRTLRREDGRYFHFYVEGDA